MSFCCLPLLQFIGWMWQWKNECAGCASLSDIFQSVVTLFLLLTPLLQQPVKILGLKSEHIHTWKRCIWWSYNNCTFSTVHVDPSPFHVLVRRGLGGEGDKTLIKFFGTFTGNFPSDDICGKHGSERVNTSFDILDRSFPICLKGCYVILVLKSDSFRSICQHAATSWKRALWWAGLLLKTVSSCRKL